jgi:hypothetical protein
MGARSVHDGFVPEFPSLLERDLGVAGLWSGPLQSLRYVLEYRHDLEVLHAQGRDACIALWSILREVPHASRGVSEAEFFLGYEPSLGVSLAEDDSQTLQTWHHAVGQLFRWSLDRQIFEATGNELPGWRDSLFDLLDEIDALLVPRLELWNDAGKPKSTRA